MVQTNTGPTPYGMAPQQEQEATTVTDMITPKVCRVSLQEHLFQKRISFTPHEYSFAKQVIQKGDDSDVEVLAATLKDVALFFAHDPTYNDDKDDTDEGKKEPAEKNNKNNNSNNEDRQEEEDVFLSDRSLPFGFSLTAGSTRRQSRIEIRRSCTTQAGLWKHAAATITRRQKQKQEDDRRRSFVAVGSPTEQDPVDESKKDDAADDRRPASMTFADVVDAIVDKSNTVGQTENDPQDVSSPMIASMDKDSEEEAAVEDEDSHKLLTRSASMNLYEGEGFEVAEKELFDSNATPHYDPWDEETDRSGHSFDFHILGTSHHDESVLPHVLSPPLMQALQESLPPSQRGESFWLKYSMVRDGASLSTLLRQVRASSNTLLAMETVEGQVFGAYCSCPWTLQTHFFGTFPSFVWRMNHSRMEMAESVWEQAKRETDIDIFPSSYDPLVQLCQADRLCVGAGTPDTPQTLSSTGEVFEPQDFGFAIALGESLLEVCSSACLSFDSPPLVINHNGVPIELVNLEVWALTPFLSEEEARHMEYHRLFLKRNATF